MKAIITGAAGFIGCHLAKRLLDEGWSVVGIDNLSRCGSTLNLDWLASAGCDKWSFRHGDIRNADELFAIFQSHADTELVFHSAAQVAVTTSVTSPRHDFEANALGTFNVLEAVRHHCPHALFIFPSTNKVYGAMESAKIEEVIGRYTFTELPRGVDESRNLDFHSPYGCSKGAADQYVRDYGRIYGLRTVVCRQSCIYGTRQFGVEDQGWVAWFMIAGMCGYPVTVYGDGKQVRDLLWVDDLIDLFLELYRFADRTCGKIYNVGGGAQNTLSVNELVDLIPRLKIGQLSVTRADWRPGDQKVYVSDISAVENDLAWRPKVGVEKGLEMMVDWLRPNIDLVQRRLKTTV